MSMKYTIDLGALFLIGFATYTAVYAIIRHIIEYNAKKRFELRERKRARQLRREELENDYRQFINLYIDTLFWRI